MSSVSDCNGLNTRSMGWKAFNLCAFSRLRPEVQGIVYIYLCAANILLAGGSFSAELFGAPASALDVCPRAPAKELVGQRPDGRSRQTSTCPGGRSNKKA